MLFLLGDELIEVAAVAEFHDDIKLLPFNDWLPVWDDVHVFELLKKFDFVENVFSLLLGFVGEFYFFYDVVLVLGNVVGEVRVTESAG